MVPTLFCAALCLLGTGLTHAEVTQKPRYCITLSGKEVTLQCFQFMDHYLMFWYRQDPGQDLRLIHYSGSVRGTVKGAIPEGYSVSRSKLEQFRLTLDWASPNQSSLYLCASSEHSSTQPAALCTKKGSRKVEMDTPPRVLNNQDF